MSEPGSAAAPAPAGRVKGTIMIEVVKFLRSCREEARQVVPPRLLHYLEGRILATSWHPEQDYLDLMRAVVELFPRSERTPPEITSFEAASRASSGAYFEGPYRSLVRRGDPRGTLASLGALWRLRHDTGDFEVRSEPGASHATVLLRDYALVARESCDLVQGTLWGMLHHSGAEVVRIEHPRCRARGAEVCEWRLEWS